MRESRETITETGSDHSSGTNVVQDLAQVSAPGGDAARRGTEWPGQKALFNAKNMEALKAALPAKSLALQLVRALESSRTEEEATRQLSAVIERRLKHAREELNAETPVA